MPEANNILSKLLNLNLKPIPYSQRKKIGGRPTTASNLWQPPIVVDGRKIEGVAFDAWRTYWPKDGSDLSGKMIEVYVPEENDKYPAYFPYWLQVSGFIGKAKIRIIDSGTKLISPKPPLPRRNKGKV